MRAFSGLVPFLLFAALLACNGDDDASPAATQAPTSIASAVPEATPTGGESPADTPETQETPVSTASGLPDSVGLQRVFPELTFERMTGLYQAPDGSWYVTEQAGRVTQVTPAAPGAAARLVMDITDRVSTDGNEEGLLGFAFAPEFGTTSEFYVYYSATDPRRSVISRFASTNAGGDPGSEDIILEVPQPFGNHNGGQIAFGPDGYLYVGLGDGGSARDPQGNGQNLGTLLGSILRLDVSSGDAGYSVPSDNPFVGQDGARGEIWAYGLRNPWRFSFDSATGDLWAGDVGQNTREEVDLVVKGGNYGWSIMEGAGCLGGGSDCDRDGLLLPVVDYDNGRGGCSVTGGFVYRGSAIPALQGAYVYSDYCTGTIWALRYDGSSVIEHEEIGQADFNVSSFAQGNDGELYVLEHGESGGIYRIVP